jgi:predicted nucleic acid-binding protein
MSEFIIDFMDDIIHTKFGQASIYVDACFLLAYMDLDDVNGDKVAKIIDTWSKAGIKEIAISNHVVGEVIHNLFKNRIREVLSITYKMKKSKKYKDFKYEPDEDNIKTIGDRQTANRLMQLVPERKLELLLEERELYQNIDQLIKSFKKEYSCDREGIHSYYNHAVDIFENIIRDFSSININTITLVSDETAQQVANSYIRLQQLDAHDALHLAIARVNQCDYFATLDGDFVHSYYSKEDMGEMKIIRVA